jgi:GPH family glycoside/pentoside/hexuronide:cation symporter
LGIAGFISGSDPATGETIITITDQEAVKEMIWLLFSIIPAFIVLIMMFLLHKYPIKK